MLTDDAPGLARRRLEEWRPAPGGCHPHLERRRQPNMRPTHHLAAARGTARRCACSRPTSSPTGRRPAALGGLRSGAGRLGLRSPFGGRDRRADGDYRAARWRSAAASVARRRSRSRRRSRAPPQRAGPQLGRPRDPRGHAGRRPRLAPPATFAPQSPLTQSALADAIAATDALQHAATSTRAGPAEP